MTVLNYSPAPGKFEGNQAVTITPPNDVEFFIIGTDANPPALSEYIAYDTLTPPGPFLAVTQDGKGNVVYDGGFPKFYNQYAPAGPITDSVTMEFKATCVGVAPGVNAFYYNAFSYEKVKIEVGDKLVYDMWMNNVNARVGIDGITDLLPPDPHYSLRDWGGIVDQNGLASHPSVDLGTRALNKWYHREFDLSGAAGYTFTRWSMAYEGETPGDFATRFRNVLILNSAGKVKAVLFQDKLTVPGNSSTEVGASGYTNLVKTRYDPRDLMSASFKFLYNAIFFCKNEVKYAAGNRKILVLGDYDDNFNIKDASKPTGFKTSLDIIIGAAGFTPTYKIQTDYPGGKLDPTAAELDGYACIMVFSTHYDSTGVGSLTPRGVNDLVSTRLTGTGLIVVTDDGNRINPTDIWEGFYATANRLVVNFGARFSGLYDRSPVNVGFIRRTYGDHPLYNGMDDSEYIFAGGSESIVVVTQVPHYDLTHPAPLQAMTGQGVHYVRVLAKMKDGSVKLETVIYIVGEGVAPIEPTNPDGSVIRGDLILDRNLAQVQVLLTPIPNATMFGFVRLGKDGETIIGEFRSSNGVSEYYWYQDPANKTHVSPQFRVVTGDKMVLQLITPFEYASPINIVVNKPKSLENSLARAINRYMLRIFPITPGGSENGSYKILSALPAVNYTPWKMQEYLAVQGETFEPDRPANFSVIIADADNPLGPLFTQYGKGEGLIYDFTTDKMYRYAYSGWELVVADGPYPVSKFFGINAKLTAKNSAREYFVNYAGNCFRVK